jgi:aminopeptidase N
MKFECRNEIKTAWPGTAGRALRKRMVEYVHADVFLDLSRANKKHFSGSVNLMIRQNQTRAQDVKAVLPINFVGRIESLFLNGQAVSQTDFKANAKGIRLDLPVTATKKKVLSIRIDFEADYHAKGLTKQIDRYDGRTYTFTRANPFSLSHLMPCLDQSNILSSFRLRVKTPAGWVVKSATRQLRRFDKKHRDAQTLTFEKTTTFPCWQFILIAGEYDLWQGPNPPDGLIPLTFIGRRSIIRNAQWGDMGFIMRHPRDFDYFR